jgi:hypothetical protein
MDRWREGEIRTGRGVVLVIILELLGRDRLAEVERERVEDIVLGRRKCLGLRKLGPSKLDCTGGHCGMQESVFLLPFSLWNGAMCS